MVKLNSINSLIIIPIIVAIIFPLYYVFFLYPSFTDLIKKNTEDEAVRTATHLTSMLPVKEDGLVTDGFTAGFKDEIRTLQNDFKLINIKIFSPAGKILYSAIPEDIGKMNQHRYYHDIVAKGNTYTKIVPEKTKTLENQLINTDVVETYVPIMKNNKFTGAFEIYYDITNKKEKLDKLASRSLIMLIILSLGFTLLSIIVYLKTKSYAIKSRMLEEFRFTAIHLSLIIIFSIFFTEMLILALLNWLKNILSISSELMIDFIESFLLVIIVYPILYYFLFKPLLLHISERNRIADILKTSEKEWNIIFNSISDMVSVHDKDYCLTRVNDTFVKNTGMRREELIGKKCYEVVHCISHPWNNCPHGRCIQSKKPEAEIVEDDNIKIPLLVSVSPILDDNGELFSTVHIAKDITEQKHFEMELTVKTYQLQKLNENLSLMVQEEIEKHRQKEQLLLQQSKLATMGEMIGVIAHQWRQPLNAIGLLIQDIQDAYEFGELDNKYISETVQNAMQQLNFMSKTIDDFRTFFKPSKEKVPFNLKEAFEKIHSILYAKLKNNYIDYKIICKIHDNADDDGTGKINCENINIIGYPNEFKHVIINIIHNAMDAIIERREKDLLGKEEGEIIIEVSKTIDKYIIKIKDNGGGIPIEIKNKIFEPYFTTKGEIKGTGIGLYMAKVIIEKNMNGKIYSENIENGSAFVIEINDDGSI